MSDFLTDKEITEMISFYKSMDRACGIILEQIELQTRTAGCSTAEQRADFNENSGYKIMYRKTITALEQLALFRNIKHAMEG